LGSLGINHLSINPESTEQQYPSSPANTDDMHILANEVGEEAGAVTLMTGFLVAKTIYMTMNTIVTAVTAGGLEYQPWTEQRRLIKEALLAVKTAITDVPAELRLESQERDENDSPVKSILDNLEYLPPSHAHPPQAQDIRNVVKTQPQVRRLLQLEIQRANIYVSWLATRAYYVDLYFKCRNRNAGYDPALQILANGGNVTEDDGLEMREEDAVRSMMTEERGTIIHDLLAVLNAGVISKRSLEPNGRSILSKLRQTLDMVLKDTGGTDPVSDQYGEAIGMVVDMVSQLDKARASSISGEDELDETQAWALLNDVKTRYQTEFAGSM
jgi:hypothetical protein